VEVFDLKSRTMGCGLTGGCHFGSHIMGDPPNAEGSTARWLSELLTNAFDGRLLFEKGERRRGE
jgi:hypothetical protein